MDWKPIGRKLKYLTVNCGGLWAVADNGDIYHRVGTFERPDHGGYEWYQVEGKLQQLSVGYNVVWGVDQLGQVWHREGMDVEHPAGTSWVHVPGHGPFKHVAVDRLGHVWAVDNRHDVYFRVGACLNQKGGLFWRKVGNRRMSQIDIGKCGVWAVDENKEIYYRPDTYNENGHEGQDWVKVGPDAILLQQVTAGGEDMMLGVTSRGELYMRADMSGSNPSGSRWVRLKGELSMIDAYGYSAWGVDLYGSAVTTTLWPRSQAPGKSVREQFQ